MVQRREVALSIVLSIVTCGIYGIYWLYKLCEDMNKLTGEPGNPLFDVILCAVTCGIYSIYLSYKWADRADNLRRKHNAAPKNNSTLFLILSVMSLDIVVWAILQGDINDELSKYGQAS